MQTNTKAILDDIDQTLRSASETTTDESTEDLTRACLILSSAIARYAPPQSPFRTQTDAILKLSGPSNDYTRRQLTGALRGIRHEYKHGALTAITELIHRDLFADFLEMARHLSDKGFKDPAAVVAAGVLEQHLRQLAQKQGVPLLKDNGENRTTESINADLAKAGAYDSATQKEVTAKLSLRNQAAHAEWDKYEPRQVIMFIDWIQYFISRFPA